MGSLTERMIKNVVLFFTLFICESTKYSLDAKVVKGNLWTHETWKFVARFCFMNNHGTFEYDVRYDEAYAVQNIDLYYDTPEQWERAYGKKSDLTTCMEKESVLQVWTNIYHPQTSFLQ
jgi:hypothetical protein